MNLQLSPPEIQALGNFFREFNLESDRGAALTAAAMLDERLVEILSAFLAETESAKELLSGFNAPLGSLASRASAAHALGLLEDNELDEITLIRKIRNQFGHSWRDVSFESGRVADLCKRLPWLGPPEFELGSSCRARFNSAIAILLTDLLWRARLVTRERRSVRVWESKARNQA